MDEAKKDLIGYLPEERGLYQDIALDQCLVYLATLKGLSETDAKKRVNKYLDRFDLAEHRRKKIKELSKGMQQKAQLIVTLIHHPKVLIIDEPFSALDPINTQMVKDLLREERERGTTVVMCTHQMNQVEELADRLVLINEGKSVLYGSLKDIRRQYAGHSVQVRTVGELPADLPGVISMENRDGGKLLKLDANTNQQEILRALMERGAEIEQFELAQPTLDEIFIRVVTREGEAV